MNLHVSKMGGLFRSLKLADAVSRLGLPLVIGAHVGDTSILTRSALTVAKPLVFGKGGRLLPGDFLDAREFGFQMAYAGYGGKSAEAWH